MKAVTASARGCYSNPHVSNLLRHHLRLDTPGLSFCRFQRSEEDWPAWRGPNWDGMARGDAPLRWSDTERVAWKATVPGAGHSSPVVWGDRIFLTTAVPAATASGGARGALPEHRFMVLAYDRKTGKPAVGAGGARRDAAQPHHQQYGSFASNSPITDGKHVFAFFGSRGLYCYTLDGNLVWQKDFGPLRMYNNFGEGAWTALDGNTLVVVLDHEGESFLVALDKATGKELWRTPRQGNTNWSGPFVTTHNGRKQVIVSASREACGYDLETGKRIWKARGLGQNTIPAPVAADGMVFVMSGYRNPNLMAIRLGREGDLTGTDAIVWQNQRGNSYTRVAGPARRQAVRPHRLRHAVGLRREDRQAPLPTDAPAEAVQLQGVAGRRERQAVPGLREGRRDRGEDGRDVRGAGDEHAPRPDVHRHAGHRRRRDLPARPEHALLHPLGGLPLLDKLRADPKLAEKIEGPPLHDAID